MFNKLRLLLKYGPEIEALLIKEAQKLAAEKREAEKHRLSLCERHNPVSGLTNFSEHNCDYCQALRLVKVYEHRLSCTSKNKPQRHQN